MNSQGPWHFLNLLDLSRLLFSVTIFSQLVWEHTKLHSAWRLCMCLSICPNALWSLPLLVPDCLGEGISQWRWLPLLLRSLPPVSVSSPSENSSWFVVISHPVHIPSPSLISQGQGLYAQLLSLALRRMADPYKLVHKYLGMAK